MKNKGTSEKRGISLIVLVITIIVIIILAVAVILSIANNNPIENAKEARFKNDVKTMQEELELLKATNYAKNNGVSYNDPEISIGDLKSATNYQEKFDVKDGELKYKEDKLTDEEKTWVSNLGVEKAPITFKKQGTEELKIGSEVEASNGEQFYVIGEGTVGTEVTDSTQDILLLAKFNLKKENGSITLKQDTSTNYNGCVFSSTNYWSSVEGIAYPDADGKYPDLNDVKKYPIPDTDTISVIKKAQKYGNDLFGVLGRLMTKEEAIVLKKKYEGILFGDGGENNYNYWLSSAESNVFIANVCGWDGSLDYDGFDEDTTFSLDDWYGVRPVIVVPASSIN